MYLQYGKNFECSFQGSSHESQSRNPPPHQKHPTRSSLPAQDYKKKKKRS